MHSIRYSRDLLPPVNPNELSFCLHSWNILSQKSLIDDYVKGQYAPDRFFRKAVLILIINAPRSPL